MCAQSTLDLATFEWDARLARFRLASHLDGQPVSIMCKSRARNAYLWQLQIFHEDQFKGQGQGPAPHDD